MQKRKISCLLSVILLILTGYLYILIRSNVHSNCNSIRLATPLSYSFDTLPDASLWHFEVYSKTNIEYVTDPVYEGNGSLRVTVRPGELVNKGARSEIVLINSDPICSEAWYRWRFLVPTDYIDNVSARWQLMGQWHDQPDAKLLQNWRFYPGHSPMVGIYYGLYNNQSAIALHYGLNEATNYTGHVVFSKGEWNEIIVHVLWSQTNEGFIEAWLNNQTLTPFNGQNYRYYGSNMYNEAPAYLKLGLYRDPNITTENSVYYDDFQRSSTAFY